jgi:hypothetical protein
MQTEPRLTWNGASNVNFGKKEPFSFFFSESSIRSDALCPCDRLAKLLSLLRLLR